MSIETKIEELRKEFNSKLDEILKPKFEVGKWYKLKDKEYCICCYQGDKSGYGVSSDNLWSNAMLIDCIDLWTPATPKEVEEALIKEAEKKYPLGTKYISVDGSGIQKIEGSFNVLEISKGLYITDGYGGTVCEYGKWAEILKTKTIDDLINELWECNHSDLKEYLTENKQDIINALNNL